MTDTPTTPPVFWTSFSPELRTELRNHLDPNQLGAAIEHPDDETSTSAISTLAKNLIQQEQYKVAEELFTYYYHARLAATGGRQNTDTFFTKYNIAYAQLEQGEFAKSESSWRELLVLDIDGTDRHFVANLGANNNLGLVLNKQGKFAEAEEVLRQLLPVMRREFHETDPSNLGCMRHLMEALSGQGKTEEARRLNEEGMVLARKCGEPHCKDEVEEMENMRSLIEGKE